MELDPTELTALPQSFEVDEWPGAAAPCLANDCKFGHGTYVAGITAGRKRVAKEAYIIAVQVYSQLNSAQPCPRHRPPCTRAWSGAIIAPRSTMFMNFL
jgi:hypothetical protein